MKTKPSKKKLKNFVVPRILPHWYEVGIMLLEEYQEGQLDMLKDNNNNDPQQGCMEMLWYWLDTHRNATWQDLLKALRSPGVALGSIATEIEKMLTG